MHFVQFDAMFKAGYYFEDKMMAFWLTWVAKKAIPGIINRGLLTSKATMVAYSDIALEISRWCEISQNIWEMV